MLEGPRKAACLVLSALILGTGCSHGRDVRPVAHSPSASATTAACIQSDKWHHWTKLGTHLLHLWTIRVKKHDFSGNARLQLQYASQVVRGIAGKLSYADYPTAKELYQSADSLQNAVSSFQLGPGHDASSLKTVEASVQRGAHEFEDAVANVQTSIFCS